MIWRWDGSSRKLQIVSIIVDRQRKIHNWKREKVRGKMKIQRKLFLQVILKNKRYQRKKRFALKIEMSETEITRTTQVQAPGEEGKKKTCGRRAVWNVEPRKQNLLQRIRRGAFDKNDWKKDFKRHVKRKNYVQDGEKV